MSWKIAPIGRGGDLLYSQAGTPSLDLRFAEKKALTDYVSGDNLVTFSRSTSGSSYATYVDSDGLIKPSPVNLLTYSEQFENTAWFRGSVTLDPNVATAPNGSQTADKLIWNSGATSNNLIRQTSTDRGTATNPIVRFDLTGSGIPTVVSALAPGSNYGITNVGNGWYRCWLYDATAGQTLSVYAKADGFNSIQLQFYVSNRYIYVTDTVATQGNGTSGVYLWGAQLETGTTPTTYIPTTSSASGAPRFDHDPTTGECLGLLVEEARTNLLLRSEEFNDATAWNVVNLAVNTNAATAPNGQATADLLTETNASNANFYVSQSTSVTSGTTYTYSIRCKPNGRSRLYLAGSSAAWGAGLITFDLLNNVVTGSGGWTGTISSLANGWYSITATRSASATGGYNLSLFLLNNSGNVTYTGDGTSGIYLWGAQLEAGSFPTSYIPTTGATATRTADVVEITGTNFSSWYNQSEGTVFCDGISISSLNSSYWSIDLNGAVGATVLVYPQNTITFQVVNSTIQVNQAFFSGTVTDRKKTAVGLKQDNFASVANGGSVILDTSGSLPGNLNKLRVGNYLDGGTSYDYSGHISRLTYWPQRLPDTTLQTITT